MTTPLTLHEAPAAGFDSPFELLEACHQRVHRMLGLLQRLDVHLAQHGADAQAKEAAHDVQRYFDIAGPAHHEDEERHLLPRLLQHPDLVVQQAAQRLREDHRRMSARWALVRSDLQGVVQAQVPARPDAARQQRWDDFAALYRDHIVLEEGVAYPAARELLDAAALQAAGREMAARRGVPVAGTAARR